MGLLVHKINQKPLGLSRRPEGLGFGLSLSMRFPVRDLDIFRFALGKTERP